MTLETQALLHTALRRAYAALAPAASRTREKTLVWHRQENGWGSEWVDGVAWGEVQHKRSVEILASGTQFRDALSVEYAALPHRSFFGLGGYPDTLFPATLAYACKKLRVLAPTSEQLDSVVADVAQFFSSPTLKVRFKTPLINFRGDFEEFQLPGQVKIRRLSDTEINDIYGGTLEALANFAQPYRGNFPSEFWIELDSNNAKDGVEAGIVDAAAQKAVATTLQALRTFKSGYIGRGWLTTVGLGFFPLGISSSNSIDNFVRPGTYDLAATELEEFHQHHTRLSATTDASMQLACRKLAEAEQRSDPLDRILDAVIGLEALLLSSMNERAGELSYRFSLNYAMISTTAEREQAFTLAKKLYGARSNIAHGNKQPKAFKIDNREYTPAEFGSEATSALRKATFFFLRRGGVDYKDPKFWNQAYLGLWSPDQPASA